MKLFHWNINYRKDLINPPGDYFSETIVVGACSKGVILKGVY